MQVTLKQTPAPANYYLKDITPTQFVKVTSGYADLRTGDILFVARKAAYCLARNLRIEEGGLSWSYSTVTPLQSGDTLTVTI